jgi:rhodanese-related sulfurtransferase
MLLTMLALAACKVWAPSRQPLAEIAIAEQNVVLRITHTNLALMEVERAHIVGDSLMGYAPRSRPRTRVAIPLADIRSVEVQKVSAARTVGLVVALGVSAAIVAGALEEDPPPPPDPEHPTMSCPLIYTWDGRNWRLDSGTFGGAIMRALQRTDLDNLDFAVAADRVLRLKVANELRETDHVDALHVLAVDHEVGLAVAPDASGGIHTLRALVRPVEASDFSGRDALARVKTSDGWNWESTPTGRDSAKLADIRDGIEVTFLRPPDARHAHLVLDGNNTPWAAYLLSEFIEARGSSTDAWYDSLNSGQIDAAAMGAKLAREAFLTVWVETSKGWMRQGLIWEAGPEVVKRQVLHLDLARVRGDTVRVRLESVPSFWLIDQVALDYSTDRPVTATQLELVYARDRQGVDVRARIAAVDDDYYVLETGDEAELHYSVPDVPKGLARSYLLRSTGWYRVHTSLAGVPDTATLRTVSEEPLGISRVAVGRLNDALNSMSRGAK